MSENLRMPGEYSAAMARGDTEAVRDGQIVEHWGGPHCEAGLGLRPTA
jgi:hypothetical protein